MNLESLEIAYLFAVIGGVVYFLLGWAWYSPLMFVKPWLAAQGKTMESMSGSGPGPVMALSVLGSFVVVFAVAAIYEWASGDGLVDGIAIGLLVAVAIVAMENFKNVVYDEQSWTLYLINNGYVVVGLAVAGAIYGAFA